jgi:hypothetical protein
LRPGRVCSTPLARFALAAAVLAALLAATSTAQAANQPHPTLDAIASEVAGRPVTVWCETDEGEWLALTKGRTGVTGFARFGDTIAYVAPSRCGALHAGLAGTATLFDLGRSLLVLLHESLHLRGIRDEGETDCTALGLVKTYAVRYFGFAELATEERVVERWVRVKRRVWVKRDGRRVRVARWVRVRRTTTVTVRVPSLALENLYAVALQEHRGSAATRPEYAGFCDR